MKNAAVVSNIKKLTEKNEPPCKKTLQKIVFLIEEKSLDLGFDYGIHFYGPYSSDLDFSIYELSNEGILNIDYTRTKHIISVMDDVVYPEFQNNIIDEVIEEFGKESPSQLELTATALYVYTKNGKNKKKIMEGVRKIKGSKYTKKNIEETIQRLVETGYVH